jgi:hypothetical protein
MPSYRLYRATRRQRPLLGDFWSDFAHGDAPAGQRMADPATGQPLPDVVLWAGVSMWDDQAIAADRARTYAQGRFICEVNIPDGYPDAVVLQTMDDPHHFSVMATPATLRALAQKRGVRADQIAPPPSP